LSDKQPDRYARLRERIDVDALRKKRVCIIGNGTMGSNIAVELIRHGVGTASPGRLDFIDPDTVELHNIPGTPYLDRHIRMPKPEALADLATAIDPQIRTSSWHVKLTVRHIPELVDRAQEQDLIIFAADSIPSMLKIADATYAYCPLILSYFGTNVDYAEIAYSIPHATPPLRATIGTRRRQRINAASALGCDIRFVTSYVAAMCLQLLHPNNPQESLPPLYANAPLHIVGLRHTYIFRSLPKDQARSIYMIQSGPHERI